jgi:hypothetical protein
MAATVRWIVSVEIKPFDGLYAELEKALQSLDRDGRRGSEQPLRGQDAYLKGIRLIRESMEKLRVPGAKHIRKEAGEVEFFRSVWPAFYSRLLFYTWLYKLELHRGLIAAECWVPLLEGEERRAAAFFQKHRNFWQFYRSGSTLINEQFTRAYSRGNLFDPLAILIDPEFATLASYRAAQGLAYEAYLGWLRMERASAAAGGDKGAKFEWRETRSAAVELIKAQVEAKSIFIDGEPATAVQLAADFQDKYNVDLEDFGKLLYASGSRKKDPVPYLTKLRNAFMGRPKMKD